MPIKKVLKWRGLSIGIEFEPGDVRFAGTDHERVMSVSYGHVRGFIGADGEALDCYLGPNLDSEKIFQLHQLTFDGEPDEDKYFFGCTSAEQVAKIYDAHMPKMLRGGIVETSLNTLKNYRRVGIESTAEITATDLKGLPSKIRFKVPIQDGKLVSIQGRSLDIESVIRACEVANKRASQGLPILVYESHPKILINPDTGDEEISTRSNPELFNQYNAFVDLGQGFLFFDVDILGSDRGQDYAEYFRRGYEPEISIRTGYDCPDKIRLKGACTIPEGEWITFDTIRPHERPGIPGSGFAMILESLPLTCSGKCAHDKPCGSTCQHSANHLIKSSKPIKKVARESSSSGGYKTKGASIMYPKSFVEKLMKQEDPAVRTAMMEAADEMVAALGKGTEVPGMEAKDDPPKPKEDMPPPAPPGFESLMALPVEQRKRAGDKLVSMVTADDNLAVLQGSVTRARSAKAKWPLPEDRATLGFESVLDVADIDTYPLHKVNSAVAKAVQERSHLSAAATWLEGEIRSIGTETVAEKKKAEEEKAEQERIAAGGKPKTTVGTESKPDPVVPKKTVALPATEEEKARRVGFEFSTIEEVKQNHRWRGSMYKLANQLAEMAPSRLKAAIKRNKEGARLMVECAIEVAEEQYGLERLNAVHDIHTSGKKIGSEAIQVLGQADYLNREFIATAIMILRYWSSAVSSIVSTSIEQSFIPGRVMNIGQMPFAQFYDVKTRERSQREEFAPAYRQAPNEPMYTIIDGERYDQYAGYYSSSAIYGTNELNMWMGAAPLYENIPEDKLFALIQEDELLWTQKVATEIMLSWMRYKPDTWLNEVVLDDNNVRNYSPSGYATLKGVKLGSEIIAVVLPLKEKLTAGSARLGPLVIPEMVARNVGGTITLSLRYPVIVDPIDGVVQVMGKYNKYGNIIPLSNRPEHRNPTFAPHPSGLIGFNARSGIVAQDFTDGKVKLGQYSSSPNYVELDFTNGSNLPQREFATQKIFEIERGITHVFDVRHADRPNVAWLPEGVKDYLATADVLSSNLTQVEFAGMDPGFKSESPFAGFRYRQQDFISSNDPILRSGHLGAVTVKGKTCAVTLKAPNIVGPLNVTVNDENGQSQFTAQNGHFLERCDFINTIEAIDENGDAAECSQFGIFVVNPPPASGLPA